MEEKNISMRSLKNPKNMMVGIIAIVAFIVSCVFINLIRITHIVQLEQLAVSEVESKASLIEREIVIAQSKIQVLALEASRRLDSAETKNVLSKISWQEQSAFEQVNFISADGISTDGFGETDYSSAEFFRRGMSGKVGMRTDFVNDSMYVIFFAPVRFGESVVGVLTGTRSGHRLIGDLLDTSMNKCEVFEAILDSKFNFIASTKNDSILKKILSDDVNNNMDLFRANAYKSPIAAFPIRYRDSESTAAIKQIGSTGWVVILVVSPDVIAKIYAVVVIVMVVIALLILIGVVFVIHFINRTNQKNRIETEEHFKNVMSALSESFGNVFEVDSDTGDCRIIRVDPLLMQKLGGLFKDEVKFNQIMAICSNKMVMPEDFHLFENVRNLDVIRETFSRSTLHEFVFRTVKGEKGFHYIQAQFVKPSASRPEFVMGFKNVDETFEAEQAKREALSKQRQALEEALNKARTADEAKSKFLFNMSHDIRTPMNAILGYDTLAKQYMFELGLPPEQTEKLARALNNIRLSGNQLLGLINSVLNMARIESGEISLDETPTNISDLTSEVIVTFEEVAREKNILLMVSRNLVHKCIECDKVKMQQIVLNVVSNAVKYTKPSGTIKVNFKEEEGDREGWCNLVATVEDNGIGISEDFLPHIFEDFEREKTATVSGIIGTGLGLSIVKKYVDLMGGSIKVSSREGVGTKVVVSTPHRIVESEESKKDLVSLHERQKMLNKRVLLVEDNAMNREIAKEMLLYIGVIVDCACDGVECLKIMEEKPAGFFDLILMDVQMPRMDGYAATRAIREMSDPLKANIQIYAMTANAFEEDIQESKNAGMNGHISKPVDPEKFYNLLSKVFS